jgi:PAS domain-containing protein
MTDAEQSQLTEVMDLSQLRRHLDRLHETGDLSTDVLVQDLETVYEELRTSEEEVRVQQEQIVRLVSDQTAAHRQQERMLALLPVAVLTTDLNGVIRSANSAASGLLRVPVGRLVGKPFFALVSSEDRPQLRRRLSEGVQESVRQVATLLRRDRSPVGAEVVVMPGQGPFPELRWVLLVADGPRDRGAEDGERLSAALMRLAGALGAADDLHGLLVEAAGIIRDGLHDQAGVSITVGSPLDPVAIGTTAAGLAQRIDGAQVVAGDGPAMAAYRSETTVVSDDLRFDGRWPTLGRHLPGGAGAAVAAPLAGDDSNVCGVLAVYLPAGHAVPQAAHVIGLFAATVAALVTEFGAKAELAGLAADLRHAMETRAVIEQAKGVIMGDRHCSDEEAFAHLVRLSSTTHVKLRDVARNIVAQVSGSAPSGG